MKLLTSKWLAAPIGIVVYGAATVLFWKTPVLPKAAAATKAIQIVKATQPSWEFTNPEAEQLMGELRQEKKALDARQKQLDETAKGLDTQKAEMAKVTQSVRKMQKDFDSLILRVGADERDNLKRLAKMYSAMAPESAVSIFGQMEDPDIAKIMLFMKDSEAAAVLEAFGKKGETEAKRVAALTERLRRSTSHDPNPK